MLRYLSFYERQGKWRTWNDKNIGNGKKWEREIQENLKNCRAAILIVSQQFLDTDYILNEELPRLKERFDKGEITIHPIILEPCTYYDHEWLGTLETFPEKVETPKKYEDHSLFSFTEYEQKERITAYVRELSILISRKYSRQGTDKTVVELNNNPYVGLAPFTTKEANRFFGRETLVKNLRKKLNQYSFLAIIGPSGSGKSSVVRAGLMPKLQAEAHIVIYTTPDNDPFKGLALALNKAYYQHNNQQNYPTEQLLDRLKDNQEALHYISEELLIDKGQRLVLVLDQWEEIFTLTKEEGTRTAFIDLLLYTVGREKSKACVVLTMRSDFMGHIAAYHGLNKEFTQHLFQLGPMNNAELKEAIEKPLEGSSVQLEAKLVDELVGEVQIIKAPLPLLQYALKELFNKQQNGRITWEAYREIKGLTGALAQRAQNEYDKLDNQSKQLMRRMLTLRLIKPGEGTEPTRRRASLEELYQNPEQQLLIAEWANARLLTTTDGYVEIAHEALISQWPQLKKWLDEDYEVARQSQLLAQEAQNYQQIKEKEGVAKAKDYLPTGFRLEQIEQLLNEEKVELSEPEKDYIRAAKILRKQQKEEEESKKLKVAKNRLRIALGAIIVSIIVIYFFMYQNNTLRYSLAENSIFRSNIEFANYLEEDNHVNAFDEIMKIDLLSRKYGLDLPEQFYKSVSELYTANDYLPVFKAPFIEGALYSYSKQEKVIIVSPEEDKEEFSIRVVDLIDKKSNSWKSEIETPTIIVTSNDGTKFILANNVGDIALHSVKGGLIHEFNFYDNISSEDRPSDRQASIGSLKFSPNDQHILIESDNRFINLFDINNKSIREVYGNYSDDINSCFLTRFSNDGTLLYTVNQNGLMSFDLMGNNRRVSKFNTDSLSFDRDNRIGLVDILDSTSVQDLYFIYYDDLYSKVGKRFYVFNFSKPSISNLDQMIVHSTKELIVDKDFDILEYSKCFSYKNNNYLLFVTNSFFYFFQIDPFFYKLNEFNFMTFSSVLGNGRAQAEYRLIHNFYDRKYYIDFYYMKDSSNHITLFSRYHKVLSYKANINLTKIDNLKRHAFNRTNKISRRFDRILASDRKRGWIRTNLSLDIFMSIEKYSSGESDSLNYDFIFETSILKRFLLRYSLKSKTEFISYYINPPGEKSDSLHYSIYLFLDNRDVIHIDSGNSNSKCIYKHDADIVNVISFTEQPIFIIQDINDSITIVNSNFETKYKLNKRFDDSYLIPLRDNKHFAVVERDGDIYIYNIYTDNLIKIKSEYMEREYKYIKFIDVSESNDLVYAISDENILFVWKYSSGELVQFLLLNDYPSTLYLEDNPTRLYLEYKSKTLVIPIIKDVLEQWRSIKEMQYTEK